MSDSGRREQWDPLRELDRDRRTERRLLWKELAVIALLVALVLLRVAFAR